MTTFQRSKTNLLAKPNNIPNANTIPADFNWKLYIQIVKNPNINNNVKAYSHFLGNCVPNNNLYKSYFRTFYNIPSLLNEETYITYLRKLFNINYSFKAYKELYKFFSTQGKSQCPLNEKYYRIHFDIPTEFSTNVYNTCYNFNYNEQDSYRFFKETGNTTHPLDEAYYRLFYQVPADFDIAAYNQRYAFSYTWRDAFSFYHAGGHTTHPLDEAYYRVFYQVPADFDTTVYNQRYAFSYSDLAARQFYHTRGHETHPLDETYYRQYYNIKDDRFKWEHYLAAYLDDCFNTIEHRTLANVFHHFSKQKYKQICPNNEPYYRALYNLPKTFRNEIYVKSVPFIFKTDPYYILDVYTHKICLSDIYNELANNAKRTSREEIFMEKYDFLLNYPEINTEKEKRYYIHLKDFSEVYYKNSDEPRYKTIRETQYVSNKKSITVVKKVKKDPALILAERQEKTAMIKQQREEEVAKIKSFSAIFGLPALPQDLDNIPVCDLANAVDEYIEIQETKEIDEPTEIKTERLERYYDSLYIPLHNKVKLFQDVQTIAQHLYTVFAADTTLENTSLLEPVHQENRSTPISPSTPIEPSTHNAIFFVFNIYPHIIKVFRNNIHKLGKHWTHTVICCLGNETVVRNICRQMNQPCNIVVLPYHQITFNEWNNTLLDKQFWQDNILGETILMYNENIFFLDEHINTLVETNTDCLGFVLPNEVNYNAITNGYSDITIRKKSFMLEALGQMLHDNILPHSLFASLQQHFTLEKIPEDILYSYYSCNFKNKGKILTGDYLSTWKNNIALLEKHIVVLNYRY